MSVSSLFLDTPGPSSASPQTDSSIDVKKDGSASKMRMHKGNLPSIPQDKLCPVCPAKFTRTTHLNRHLRTREWRPCQSAYILVLTVQLQILVRGCMNVM